LSDYIVGKVQKLLANFGQRVKEQDPNFILYKNQLSYVPKELHFSTNTIDLVINYIL